MMGKEKWREGGCLNKVRIGFIGVGGMAQTHMKALQRMEDAEIAAVCDINETLSRQIASTYGAASYPSFAELLKNAPIDALFVCTPPFARAGIEQEAARKGIHLLAEKPLGLDMAEVREKERAILQAGIIHSSGYCLRYLDNVQRAKDYLADKSVDMVLAYRIGGLPGTPWWRIMERSGGQLVEQSTHQVDLIRYVAGEFREVQAVYEQRHIREMYPEATIYDVGIVTFRLRSGAVGTISNTCLSRHMGRGDVELIGRDFYVSISGKEVTIADGEGRQTCRSEQDFVYEQDRAFVDAVRTGRQDKILCGYSEAAATLEVTLAANRSAAEGHPVVLA
jgi:predicted dehydrogenase